MSFLFFVFFFFVYATSCVILHVIYCLNKVSCTNIYDVKVALCRSQGSELTGRGHKPGDHFLQKPWNCPFLFKHIHRSTTTLTPPDNFKQVCSTIQSKLWCTCSGHYKQYNLHDTYGHYNSSLVLFSILQVKSLQFARWTLLMLPSKSDKKKEHQQRKWYVYLTEKNIQKIIMLLLDYMESGITS